MPIDVETKRSPGWWLWRASQKLEARLETINDLWARYEGDPPLPEGSAAAKETFRAFLKQSRTNFAALIVESLQERQEIRAIRVRDSEASGDEGDAEAMAVYEANGFDLQWGEMCTKSLAMGDAYALASIDPRANGRQATIDDIVLTAEDPRQVVTFHNPLRQQEIIEASKFFYDPIEEVSIAYAYYEGRAYRATSAIKPAKGKTGFSQAWDWDEEYGGADGLEIPGGVRMPMVRQRNKDGRGEYEPHIDILDRINSQLLQRMVISTYQAFRQRALMVPKESMPDRDPITGDEIDWNKALESGPDAVWRLPETAKIWESGQVDLQGILSAIKDDIKDLAAVVRRPMSLFSPDSANQSAEGASLTRESLSWASDDRNKRARPALAQLFAIGFQMIGDTSKSKAANLAIDFMPVDRYTVTAKATAAQAAKGAGMSAQWILENVWQATRSQIERENAARLEESLLAIAPTSNEQPPSPAV